MTDQSDLAEDLLYGGQEIALAIYGKKDKATVRRLYHEQARWPIFKLDDSGVLYALRSRIKAHLAAKSAEKEAQILAATQAAAGRKTVRPKTPPQKTRVLRRRSPRPRTRGALPTRENVPA